MSARTIALTSCMSGGARITARVDAISAVEPVEDGACVVCGGAFLYVTDRADDIIAALGWDATPAPTFGALLHALEGLNLTAAEGDTICAAVRARVRL